MLFVMSLSDALDALAGPLVNTMLDMLTAFLGCAAFLTVKVNRWFVEGVTTVSTMTNDLLVRIKGLHLRAVVVGNLNLLHRLHQARDLLDIVATAMLASFPSTKHTHACVRSQHPRKS